jgi:thiol-disulfide isomerase/thioredoxin
MNIILSSILLSAYLLSPLVMAETPNEVKVGSVLREAKMQGLNVPSKELSAYRGKPLIINVWASWCGPCREEMGSLQRLASRYKGKPFNVIGISTDDYHDRASAFLRLSSTTFDNFIDSNLLLENMLGANTIPLTLLIDAQASGSGMRQRR